MLQRLSSLKDTLWKLTWPDESESIATVARKKISIDILCFPCLSVDQSLEEFVQSILNAFWKIHAHITAKVGTSEANEKGEVLCVEFLPRA